LDDYQALMRKYQSLSQNYNDIIQKETLFLQKKDVARFGGDNLLKDFLLDEKETQFETSLEHEDVVSLKERIIGLQLSESNHKKKAKLALKQMALSDEIKKDLEDRISQLEQENIELSQHKRRALELETSLR
jgi:hypothetical protein